MTAIAPNPYSPYATADSNSRHLIDGFFGPPIPAGLIPTACERLAVVPDEPLNVAGIAGPSWPEGMCGECISAYDAQIAGREYVDDRPVTDCRECESQTRHDGLCALCRQEKHDAWWPTRDASIDTKEPTT